MDMSYARIAAASLLCAFAASAGAMNAVPGASHRDWTPQHVALDPGTLDLTLDADFLGGTAFVDNPTDGGSHDHGLVVAENPAGGYWLIGTSSADDGVHQVPVVSAFADDGSTTGPVSYPSDTTLTQLTSIVAATVGVNNGTPRIYVVGTYTFPTFDDYDFGVLCLDPANAFHGCAGFGTGGFIAMDFDLGGSDDDVPVAVTYDALAGTVYVLGNVSVAGGTAVGVFRFDSTTGAYDNDWGNLTPTSQGRFAYTLPWTSTPGAAAHAIVAGSPMLFEHDVFVVGASPASDVHPNDFDGFILPIDAVDGTGFDPLWNNGELYRVAFDLGQNTQFDSLTAVSLRHNGNLLIAGIADDDSGQELILGELDPVGAPRTDFCSGTGICAGNLYNAPVATAVVERPGDGSIVVGANNLDNDFNNIQGVYQIDPGGHTVTAFDQLSWPSNAGEQPLSYTTSVLVDSQNRVLQSGWRFWRDQNSDDDMTIARWRADDTIFGNDFGGRFAD
jgi:hypothetical protein